jgi:hypothetical protein
MARYRLLESAFIQSAKSVGPAQYKAGAEVQFDGLPSLGMVPLDREAAAAKAESIRDRLKRRLNNTAETALLARSLGATGMENTAEFIERWLSDPQPYDERISRFHQDEIK